MKREIVRHADVLRMTKLSRTTLWRLQRAGKFPKSFFISPEIKGWLRADVERWVEDRIHGRALADYSAASEG